MADVNITTRLVGNKQVTSAFSKLEGQVASMAKRFGALAIAAAGAGLVVMAKQTIDAMDNLAKMSQRIGVSVEELSSLQLGAELSGSSLNELGSSLRFLSRSMDEAAQGAAEYAEVYDRLGVAVTDTNTGALRPTIDVLGDIAEAFSGMADGAAKTSIASQILGRAGSNLIPMLNQGRDALEGWRKEAEQFGLVISTEAAQAAERFNDSITRLNAALRGAMIQSITPIINPLASMAARFAEVSKEGSGFATVSTGILFAMQAITSAASIATRFWTAWARTIGAVGEAIAAFVQLELSEAADIVKRRLGEIGDEFDELKKDLSAIWDPAEASVAAKAYADAVAAGLAGGNAAADSALGKLKSAMEGLQAEYIGLVSGEAAVRQFEFAVGSLSEATGATADLYRKNIVELDALIAAKTLATAVTVAETEATKMATAAQDAAFETYVADEKRKADALKATATALQESIDPQKLFFREQEELNDLREAGLITLSDYNDLLTLSVERMNAAYAAGVGLNAVTRESLKDQQAYNKLLADTADKWERATFPIIEFNEQMKLLDTLLRNNEITTKAYNKAVAETEKAFQKAVEGAEVLTEWQVEMLRATQGWSQDFTNAINKMLTGAEQSFTDFRDAVFNLFRKAMIQRFITSPLLDAVDEIIKGLNKAQNGASSGGFLASLGSIFGGAIAGGGGGGAPAETPGFAKGGVLPAGFTGLVGERGPEFVTPASNTRVIPNGALGGAITINQHFQTGVTRAELASIIPRIKAETIAAVVEAKQRGGRFSRAF